MLPSATSHQRAQSLRKELAYLGEHFSSALNTWNKIGPRTSGASKVTRHDKHTLLTALIEYAQATIR